MSSTVFDALKSRFPDAVLGSAEFRGDTTVDIRCDSILPVCQFLRDEPSLAFTMLVDLCGVDRYLPERRFAVMYHLYSMTLKDYLALRVAVEENEPVVPSVTGLWQAANWHERETYDMFGIRFDGHPDLRRMYMPEDFEYYPLRKDFPLMGIPDSIPLPRR